ncbi:hypothetical protein T439DRAFT_376175 [Meredithblackwellia eburnea MCA 4105]
MAYLLTPSQAAKAASAYRALIRAQKFTFKGDTYALKAAHEQTRAIFNRFVPSATPSASTSTSQQKQQQLTTSEEVEEHIQAAFEIATYLRRNVVQGIEKEDGAFALRFTEETERGDNATIKAPKKHEAREMRGPTEENKGVRRRRRAPAAATKEPVVTCCGGGAGTGPSGKVEELTRTTTMP